MANDHAAPEAAGAGAAGAGAAHAPRARRARLGRGLVTLAAAGGILLTGCTGGTHQATDTAQKGGSSGTGGAPAPAAPGEQGTPESAQRRDGEPDFVPPPDYLSTFALDVDTASYGYARRSLKDGRLPAPATVRPEEFINSFRQEYPRPKGNGLSVSTDGARITGAPGPDVASEKEKEKESDWSLLRVGLATKAAPPKAERPPAALTFVIDVSGSMSEPGRLDLVKDSLRVMTDQLRADDSIAIVTFSGEAETVLPMTRLGDSDSDGDGDGDGDGRDRVRAAVDELEPTDSTNLDAGVRTGYDTAVEGVREGATNRVVLLSDALANTGETSADAILERIASARREHGITLFGVGVGSDYGDALMERLANKGDGHTSYVSDEATARRVFRDELPAHIDLLARDAKAQVAFDPKTVDSFRLIGYDNRQVADEDFRNDRVDGGELGPGHTVTALYAVRLKESVTEAAEDAGDRHVATARVRWLDPKSRAPHEESERVEVADLRRELWDGADQGLQVTAAAAYFADALRTAGGEPGGPDYDPSYEPGGPDVPRPAACEGADTATTKCGHGTTGQGGFRPLPGAMSLGELRRQTDRLAESGASQEVRDLARAVARAAELRG